MSFGQSMLALLLIAVCSLLMIVILLQRGRGGGLAGAFGGAGGTSAFGAKTGDVFTWITVVVAAVFVLLAVLGTFVFDESAPPVVVAPAAPEPMSAGTPMPVQIDDEGRLIPVDAVPGAKVEDEAGEAAGAEGAKPEPEGEPEPAAPSGAGPAEATPDPGSEGKPDAGGDDNPPTDATNTPEPP